MSKILFYLAVIWFSLRIIRFIRNISISNSLDGSDISNASKRQGRMDIQDADFEDVE